MTFAFLYYQSFEDTKTLFVETNQSKSNTTSVLVLILQVLGMAEQEQGV